jgi:hypothetical protein
MAAIEGGEDPWLRDVEVNALDWEVSARDGG